MLTAYLFSLALGGTLLAYSVIAGGDNDSDVDSDVDTDLHTDMDSDIQGDVGHSAHHPDASDFLSRLLSLRNITFALAFFGLTGCLGTWLTSASSFVLFPTSVGIGLMTALCTHIAFERLRQSQPSSGVDQSELEGSIGLVVLPMNANQMGQIKVTAKGRQIEMRARPLSSEDRTFDRHEKVVIVRIENGVAEVTAF